MKNILVLISAGVLIVLGSMLIFSERLEENVTPTEVDPIQQNEEIEDSEMLSVYDKTWKWVSAEYNDGRMVTPNRADAFTLTFAEDNSFSASTDCNGVGGRVVMNDSQISFGEMMSTLMYCEGSQEQIFTQLLSDATEYHITANDELVLGLQFDSGTVLFR